MRIIFFLSILTGVCFAAQWEMEDKHVFESDWITVPAMDKTMSYGQFPLPTTKRWAWNNLKVAIIDEQGQNVPPTQVYLHHTLIGSLNRSSVMCRHDDGRLEQFAYIGGAGGDLTPTNLPAPYAVVVEEGEFWSWSYHLVSQLPNDHKVRFRFTLQYMELQDTNPPDLMPVEVIWFDVTGNRCHAGYDVEAGSIGVNFKSLSIPSPWEGTLVYTLGHLHRGGLKLALSHNNVISCDSTATYGPAGGGFITHMDDCSPKQPVKIGDTFTLVSLYDDAVAIEGAMGIFLSYGHVEKRVDYPDIQKYLSDTLPTTDNEEHDEDTGHSESSSQTWVVIFGLLVVLILENIAVAIAFAFFYKKKSDESVQPTQLESFA